METFICKECGKKLEYNKLSTLRAQVTGHLKKEHGMTIEEYIVKHELNGIRPKCACGCGEDVHWNAHTWKWNKYVADSHVGKERTEYGKELRKRILDAKKYTFNTEEYYKTHYDIESLKQSVVDFKSKKYTLSELEDKYKLDKRTLEKAWFSLNLITESEYQDVVRYLKYNIGSEKRKEKILLSDSVYVKLYSILEANPKKHTISSLISEYNKGTVDKIVKHPSLLYRQMKDIYGDIIDVYLVKGYHSNEEYDFYKILTFYFPDHYIKLGYLIKYGTGARKFYIYDLCIDDKLLIEYDSDGKYHDSESAIAKDKEKEDFAIKKGYVLKRLSKDDVKDINILNKIKEWLSSLKK